MHTRYFNLITLLVLVLVIFNFSIPYGDILCHMVVLHDPIDAVILWVDGSDPKWRKRYNERASVKKFNSRSSEFRDRYMEKNELVLVFTCIEKYMPWINKIHLVVDDQVPYWLNLSHPKIRIVNHRQIFGVDDYHSFNSISIQANLFNIPGLSEKFLLFDDDLTVTKELKISDFFTEDGIPLTRGSIDPGMNVTYMHKFMEACRKNPKIDGAKRYHANIAMTMKKFGNVNHFIPHYASSHVVQPFLKSNVEELYKIYKLDSYRNFYFRSCTQIQLQTLFINHVHYKYSVDPVSVSTLLIFTESECKRFIRNIEEISSNTTYLCFNGCSAKQMKEIIGYYGGSSFILKGTLTGII